MYGLGVGISMVFKIFRQFPIYEGGGWPQGPYQCIAYIACNIQYMFLKLWRLNEEMLKSILYHTLWVILNFPKWPWVTLVHKPWSEGTLVFNNTMQFLMRGVEDTSSNGHNSNSMIPQNFRGA
jgi:hypothetical protein